MKNVVSLCTAFFLFANFALGQSIGGFNVATNYGNTARNLAFTNRIFNKNYTSMPTASSSTNPGMITAEFLQTFSGGTACGGGAACSSYSHKGLDQGVGGSTNVSLYSPISGVVRAAGGSFGTIAIFNSTWNCTFIFLHCSTIGVSVGNMVSIGTYVGKSGSAGASAVHVHSELRSGDRSNASCQCSSAVSDGVFDPRITIDLIPVPAQTPVLSAPAQNASNLTGNINFTWTCPNATEYRLQIIESGNYGGFTTTDGFSGVMAYNSNVGNVTSFIWTNAQQGKTYYWTVRANNAGGTSPFAQYRTFSTSAAPAPANNEVCGAITLPIGSTCTYTYTNNTGATTSSYPSSPGTCGAAGKDVWFKATVPSSGIVTIRTQAGSMTNGVMAIYSGTTCSNLSYLTCEDDNGANLPMPVISVSRPVGSIVWIRFWGYNNSTGSFSLCVLNYQTNTAPVSNNPLKLARISAESVDGRAKETEGSLAPQITARAFPSPANDVLHIETTSEGQQQGVRFILINMLGEVVWQETRTIENDRNELSVDVSRFATGAYLLSVGSSTFQKEIKVLIGHP